MLADNVLSSVNNGQGMADGPAKPRPPRRGTGYIVKTAPAPPALSGRVALANPSFGESAAMVISIRPRLVPSGALSTDIRLSHSGESFDAGLNLAAQHRLIAAEAMALRDDGQGAGQRRLSPHGADCQTSWPCRCADRRGIIHTGHGVDRNRACEPCAGASTKKPSIWRQARPNIARNRPASCSCYSATGKRARWHRARGLATDGPLVSDTIGWVLARQGDHDDALAAAAMSG